MGWFTLGFATAKTKHNFKCDVTSDVLVVCYNNLYDSYDPYNFHNMKPQVHRVRIMFGTFPVP